MSPVTQTILEAGVPTLAVMIGLIVDSRAFKRLSERMGTLEIPGLFDDLEETVRSDLRRMAERLR